MTDVSLYLVLLVSSFLNVAVRAFQQINVTRGHYWRIPPTSYLFALGDALVMTNIVAVVIQEASITLAVIAMGTGGWMGCFVAMTATRHLDGHLARRKAKD